MHLWWTVVAVLLLSNSNAQLTSPSEAVCAGARIRFSCVQNGTLATWTVNLSPSMTLSGIVLSNLDGSILHFQGDPGFNFEIHVISSTSNRLTTELRVTAVRELNGVTVQCAGASGSFVSVIQVVPVDPPPAPSGVMTFDNQYTKTGASVCVTWSPSRGADNYIISVTPLATIPGQILSNFTTTNTSVYLTLEYNVNYTINIAAKNYCGSNTTILSVILAGCGPPSPPANGRINNYLNGSVRSQLTYRCDTGYLPHEQMVSTCMSNGSWIPTPHCVLADCGTPIGSCGVIFEPFNNTLFDSMVSFHCQDGLKPETVVTAVCGIRGIWNPNPSYHFCVNQSDNNVDITEMLSNTTQVAITAVVCSVAFFLFGILVGALCHRWAAPVFMKPYNKKHSKEREHEHSHSDRPAAVTAPVLYEEVKLSSDPTHSEQNIELQENAAYGQAR